MLVWLGTASVCEGDLIVFSLALPQEGPVILPSPDNYPASCPQNNQSYEEVVEGGVSCVGAESAIAGITAVSTGDSTMALPTVL